MINFILMFLFCCNGKDDGYKLGKNICFFIIMFLSIKDILDEKEKKELQEIGSVGIKFFVI